MATYRYSELAYIIMLLNNKTVVINITLLGGDVCMYSTRLKPNFYRPCVYIIAIQFRI